jgi:uncharacterized protein (UPF0332 family)
MLSLADKLREDGARSATLKRRSVSTAYYAVFHALARCCADELLGKADRSSKDYERVYRALDHGPLKSAFKAEPLNDNPALNAIGALVAALQSARHRADYLPPGKLFNQAECRELIETAKTAVDLLDQLGPKDRRMLAVHLLFKNRLS